MKGTLNEDGALRWNGALGWDGAQSQYPTPVAAVPGPSKER